MNLGKTSAKHYEEDQVTPVYLSQAPRMLGQPGAMNARTSVSEALKLLGTSIWEGGSTNAVIEVFARPLTWQASRSQLRALIREESLTVPLYGGECNGIQLVTAIGNRL